MNLAQCQVPGCTSEDTHNTGICNHHWDQLPNGYQYKLATTVKVSGTNHTYTTTLKRLIDMSQEAGRFKPMQ